MSADARRGSKGSPQRGRRTGTPGDDGKITPAVLARSGAARVVSAVLTEQRTFDEALATTMAGGDLKALEPRDLAFARLIAVTTLRRLGQIDDVLARFLSKPLDRRAPFARAVLQSAVAQLLFLDAPAHAVIDVSVRAIKAHRKSQHFAGLTNAVLRRISERGGAIVTAQDAAALNTPLWLMERWMNTYGADVARSIAEAHLDEPSLDLTLNSAADDLPDDLAGVPLATGSLRLANSGRIDGLPGYDSGTWWVQDAAAALPARLLGDVAGKTVLDLCAAPGGKTAQLCAAGATVTALDSSRSRMTRVEANMKRLGFNAELVVADATTWIGGPFDAVLLDAPCSSTGTIRRHPDIPHLKTASDITELAGQQAALLAAAADRVAVGGRLVFCTCSLEPEEGPEQIARFLAARSDFALDPVVPADLNIPENWITTEGYLRTLPCHAAPLAGNAEPPSAGVDGFFAARLVRTA